MQTRIKVFHGLAILAVLAVTASGARAQNPSPGLSEQQIEKMYQDYYNGKNQLTAGDQDASVTSADGTTTPLSGALATEQQPKKVYHYDGKNRILYGVELPQRLFNNIDYPY